MNLDRFKSAKPAHSSANIVSPIKITVSKEYGRNSSLPSVLTFNLATKWLEATFGDVDKLHVEFMYDNTVSPPVGILEFGSAGARLANGGNYSLKANFHAWHGLSAEAYKPRTECPIIEQSGHRVYFHMPPSATKYDPNTGKWHIISEIDASRQ